MKKRVLRKVNAQPMAPQNVEVGVMMRAVFRVKPNEVQKITARFADSNENPILVNSPYGIIELQAL